MSECSPKATSLVTALQVVCTAFNPASARTPEELSEAVQDVRKRSDALKSYIAELEKNQ